MAVKKMTGKTPGTDIVDWEAEMAAQAAQATEAEKLTGGGKFFSTKSGVLTFDDTPMPGNQMAVVILDSIAENVYYGSSYDPDNRAPPKCFAFSRDESGTLLSIEDMEPHSIVDKETDTFERQADGCHSCPNNEWGSAETGRGKACGNRRRLAVIPAGSYVSQGKGKGYELELFDDEELFAKSDFAFVKLPVMSVKAYTRFVHSVAEEFKRPPHGVFARIWLEPDQKSNFRVEFEVLEEVPKALLPVIMRRHTEATKEIAFPYTPFVPEEEEAKPSAAKRASGNSKLAKGRGAKK
jgi:hypothetical protein